MNVFKNFFNAAAGIAGKLVASILSSSWRLPSANMASYSAFFESKYS